MPEFVLPVKHKDSFAITDGLINEVAQQAYEALVWSEGIDDDADVDDSVVIAVHLAVSDFLSNATVRDLIKGYGLKPDFLGHNLILSGNHHGTGFWDRGLPEEAGKTLHNYSVGVEVYEGDNGTWYA